MQNLLLYFIFILCFAVCSFGQRQTKDSSQPEQKESNVVYYFSDPAGDYLGQPARQINPKVRLFPNPATNYFQVDSNIDFWKVTVFNIVGRKVKDYIARDGKHYNIEELPMGMYLVQIKDNKNKTIATRRLSKKEP